MKMPVYEYIVIVNYGDGKKKKEKRYKYDYKKVVDGVQHHRRKQGFYTRDEALADEWNDRQSLGKANEEKKTITIDGLFSIFIESSSLNHKPTTIEGYKFRYKRILEYFGNVALTMIKSEKIVKFKRAMVDEGLSDDYINKIIYLLRDMLLFAKKKNYLLNENCIDDLVGVKTAKVEKERIALSQEQVTAFFSTFDLTNDRDNLYYHFFRILLDSTMRPNEYRCLMKKDIKGQYLCVNKTCTTKLKGQGLVLQSPKTKGSVRNVLMPKDDIDYLLELTKNYDDEDFIFGKTNVLSETTIKRELDTHTAMAELPRISLYNFRHTSITLMLKDKKVPLLVVSKRAGHSNASTTMNHYWHLFTDDDAEALNGLNWDKNDENTQLNTQEQLYK